MGCETVHYYTQTIDNQSSRDIEFHFSGNITELYGDSVLVPAGEEVVLQTFNKLGAQPEGLDCGINAIADVVLPDSLTLTKDWSVEGNWISDVDGKRTVTQVCTFIITDADLQ